MNLLAKFIFFLKRPKVILVAGNGRQTAAEALFQILNQKLKGVRKLKKISIFDVLKEKILILEMAEDKENFDFLIKKSELPILVVTHVGEPSFERISFAGEISQISEILELAEDLPAFSYLVLNYDDETIRDIQSKSRAHPLTFGFGQGADFQATDVILTQFPERGTNFKVNYKGNIIPIWLKNLFGKEQIYASLAAASIGTIFGLNLVETSEALRFYSGLPGKMRLIEGIKKSWILDDSESATVFSMIEAIETLKMIEAPRKIAVLGDVLGVGKYSIEAHEAIGERVAKAAEILFTVGPRAKFISQGAIAEGMPEQNTFHFDKIEEAGKTLQKEIKKDDLILVDGSREMGMEEIVKEIKAS